jgi:FkbM family methyltransferase
MISVLRGHVLGLPPGPLAGRLRSWKLRRLVGGYPPRVVSHDYGGRRLQVYVSDPLAEGWYDHDWAELPEIAALRGATLRPGARVFDAGAHQGVVAAMLAREVGPSGQIVAVEPNPHNAAAARRNRDLNQLSQIEVLQAAVSDRPGRVVFNEGLNGQLDDGGAYGRLVVDAVTLDEMARRFGTPDVVFIDVEGAECLALDGAADILGRDADFFVEVHVGCGLEKLGGTVDEVLRHFPEDRFTRLVRAEADSTFRPLSAGDPLLQDRFFLLARRRTART